MKPRVLIADDNPDAANALGRLATLIGCEVKVVYNGPDAIEGSACFEPNLIFVDLAMPFLDGYETARAIRNIGLKHVNLIALTGYAAKEDQDHAYAAGFDLHVAKPLGVDELRQLLLLPDPSSAAARVSPRYLSRIAAENKQLRNHAAVLMQQAREQRHATASVCREIRILCSKWDEARGKLRADRLKWYDAQLSTPAKTPS